MKGYHAEYSMSTVMQCVQELKAWQELEQQKLCENPNLDTSKNEMENVLESFDIPENVRGIDNILNTENLNIYIYIFCFQFRA